MLQRIWEAIASRKPARCCAAVLAVCVSPAPPAFAQEAADDPRVTALRQFFLRYRAPVHPYAGDFVKAADKERLDWRLLPSIAMAESGGGKNGPMRNLFGWKSGKARFASTRESIYYVASRLGGSPVYRGKSLARLLATYNPVPGYPDRIYRFMRQLHPAGAAAHTAAE